MPDAPLALAADVGGTSTKVALATADGTVVATSRGPGANLRSAATADALRTALGAAVADVLCAADAGPGRIAAGVLGISGAGAAGRPRARALVDAALADLGITASVEVEDDLRIAFAAAGLGDDGILLLAGTGAVGCRFERGTAAQRVDGLGWVLGDAGSGTWIGREVLRAAAADLDRRGPATALTSRVQELAAATARADGREVPATGDPCQDLIALVDGLVPSRWGLFAPLLAEAPGDAVAGSIAVAAAGAVGDQLAVLERDAPAGPPLPIALAGAVLTAPGPVADRVRAALAGRIVALAETPLTGAVRLAAARLG